VVDERGRQGPREVQPVVAAAEQAGNERRAARIQKQQLLITAGGCRQGFQGRAPGGQHPVGGLPDGGWRVALRAGGRGPAQHESGGRLQQRGPGSRTLLADDVAEDGLTQRRSRLEQSAQALLAARMLARASAVARTKMMNERIATTPTVTAATTAPRASGSGRCGRT